MSVREQVASLLDDGVPPAEIARRIGVAPATVDYHVARLRRRTPDVDEEAPHGPPSTLRVDTRERVAALLAKGLGQNAIARELGLTKSTVSYHARRLGKPVDSRCARRYDWTEIHGAVVARRHGLPLDELLTAGVYRSRFNLKLRLVKAGLKQRLCEMCGIASWNGRPITLALHHVNGDRYDHRIENLQLLCPNCHSQTNTFAGRNGRSEAQATDCRAQSRYRAA